MKLKLYTSTRRKTNTNGIVINEPAGGGSTRTIIVLIYHIISKCDS